MNKNARNTKHIHNTNAKLFIVYKNTKYAIFENTHYAQFSKLVHKMQNIQNVQNEFPKVCKIVYKILKI